jgi:hypothetical protein
MHRSINPTTSQRATLIQSFIPYEEDRAATRIKDGAKQGGAIKNKCPNVELDRGTSDRDRAGRATKLAGERVDVSARMVSHAQKVVDVELPKRHKLFAQHKFHVTRLGITWKGGRYLVSL